MGPEATPDADLTTAQRAAQQASDALLAAERTAQRANAGLDAAQRAADQRAIDELAVVKKREMDERNAQEQRLADALRQQAIDRKNDQDAAEKRFLSGADSPQDHEVSK